MDVKVFRMPDQPTSGAMARPSRLLPLVCGAALLAACATSGRGGDETGGACRPDAARGLINRLAPDDAAILRSTGSDVVQRLAPGDPVTRDFRAERVRVTVDPAGRIVAAFCG